MTLKESVVELLSKSRIEHLSVSLGNESRLDFYRSLVSLTTYFFLRRSHYCSNLKLAFFSWKNLIRRARDRGCKSVAKGLFVETLGLLRR